LVVKKKVTAASVSSMEAFLMAWLVLQLEVPKAAVTNILGWMVQEECWNSSLDGRLEAVVASIQCEVVVGSIQLEAAVAASI
jgi:hypothetical protein